MRCVHLSCHHPCNHQLGSSIFKSAPHTEQNCCRMCAFELSSCMQSSALFVNLKSAPQSEQNCYQMCSFELSSLMESVPLPVYFEISTTIWTELLSDVFIWIVITHGISTFACLFRNQRSKSDGIMVCCIHWNQNSEEYINWLVGTEIEEDLWLCCWYKMFTYIVSVLNCFFLRSLWSDGWL